MTTPEGRTPHPDDPAEGPEEPGSLTPSATDPHPDSRGEHAEEPAEGPVSIPAPRGV